MDDGNAGDEDPLAQSHYCLSVCTVNSLGGTSGLCTWFVSGRWGSRVVRGDPRAFILFYVCYVGSQNCSKANRNQCNHCQTGYYIWQTAL